MANHSSTNSHAKNSCHPSTITGLETSLHVCHLSHLLTTTNLQVLHLQLPKALLKPLLFLSPVSPRSPARSFKLLVSPGDHQTMQASSAPLFIFFAALVSIQFQTLHGFQSNPLFLSLSHSLSHTQNPNFTVLHHLKASSMRSAARQQHRRHLPTERRRRQQVSLPLYPGSDYTLSLAIVGPSCSPTTVSLYMDTGSDIVWFPCAPFECIMCQGKPSYSPFGVAGFGRGVLSLPAELAAVEPALAARFSYCLVSHSFKPDKLLRPSPLILGRSVPDQATSFLYTRLLHNPKHPYFYSVAL